METEPKQPLHNRSEPSHEQYREDIADHESRHLLVDTLLNRFIAMYYISPLRKETHEKIRRLIPAQIGPTPGEIIGVQAITRAQQEAETISRLAGLTADAERLNVDDPMELQDVSPDDVWIPIDYVHRRMQRLAPEGAFDKNDVPQCLQQIFAALQETFQEEPFATALRTTKKHMLTKTVQVFPFVKKNLLKSLAAANIDAEAVDTLRETLNTNVNIDQIIQKFYADKT